MKPSIVPICFTGVFFLLATAAPGYSADRPNILFIYTDDHSHRTISCYPEAYDWVRTPNIDALYDLETDPKELTNLALEKSHRDRLLEFREAAVAEMKRTDAGMANRLPAVAMP